MKVLLVEDSRDGALLTRQALRRAGLKLDVELVRSGAAALDAVAREGPVFELVLLDLKMPGMNGIEVLERVREMAAGERVPVVVLTSSHEPGDVLASYAAGASIYVRKPVNFEEMIDVLGQVARFYLGLSEEAPRHAAIVERSGLRGTTGGPSAGDASA